MRTADFFRARLDQMLALRHPLAVLATRLAWPQIESALQPLFAPRPRVARCVVGADLFGVSTQLAAQGPSAAGRPRLPIRLMAGLLYLKHAFNESDERAWYRNGRRARFPRESL